jgi:hypothetical protein
MFQPNRPSSGVQVVMVKDSAAHCNMVFFPPIAVASGYFGYVGYHQFYLIEIRKNYLWIWNMMGVTDLTLGTSEVGKLMNVWHVSDKPSLITDIYAFRKTIIN